MKLILEGPDNAGKTTLADMLRREIPSLVYHHPGGRPADFAAELACMGEQTALLHRHPSILMDRCTGISQQVYTPDPENDKNRNLWVTATAAMEDVLIVYCRPSTDWLMSFENFTWREGETEEFKREIIEKQHVFIQRYDALFSKVPHVHYDYKHEDASAIIKHLVLAMTGNETSMKLLQVLKTFEVSK